MNRAVFFDRDGTLIEDAGYLSSPEEVEVLPGAAEAVRRLNQAGFLVVVVSNQSGVARGMFTTDDVERVNERIRQLLDAEGARVDAFYYCPHLPTGTAPAYAKDCECRKPKPGMLYEAAQDLDIDLTESFMVGDALRDVQAGRAAQCQTIFVGALSDTDPETLNELEGLATPLAGNLLEAVELILPASAGQAPEEEGTQVSAPSSRQPATPSDEPVDATRAEQPEPSPAESRREEAADFEAMVGSACDRCGRAITPEELEEKRAVHRQGRYLCPVCVEELRTRRLPTNGSGEPQISAILEELRNITRELSFERFSLLNLLGGVLQVAAIYFVFRAYQYHASGTAGETTILLWAILIQLITLTCFVMGRR